MVDSRKVVLDGGKYRGVFTGEHDSFDTSYEDHAYYREYTVYYLNVTGIIRDKQTGQSFVSRFQAGRSEHRPSLPSLQQAVFPYDEKRVISERRAVLIDYLLGTMIEEINDSDPDTIASTRMPTPSVADLVRRGFLFDEKGMVKTLFPITSEGIPISQDREVEVDDE